MIFKLTKKHRYVYIVMAHASLPPMQAEAEILGVYETKEFADRHKAKLVSTVDGQYVSNQDVFGRYIAVLKQRVRGGETYVLDLS